MTRISMALLLGLFFIASVALAQQPQSPAPGCPPLFGPGSDPCSGHGVCVNTTTGYYCNCHPGWTHHGDIFTIPEGSDCVTNLTPRLVMHVIGYVVSVIILVFVVIRTLQLRPFDLRGLARGGMGQRYLFHRRLCLIQAIQTLCALTFYCLVLFGNYFVHESLPTSIFVVISFVLGLYKHTLISANQLSAALSSLGSNTKGTISLLKPGVIFLYVGVTIQSIACIVFYMGIWGIPGYSTKIALFRTILGFSCLGQLWFAVVQILFTTRLINELEDHIKTSPSGSNTDILAEAISRLRPQRATAAFVVPLFITFNTVTAIFPMIQTYYMAAVWIFAGIGEISTLVTLLPRSLGLRHVSDEPSSTTPSSRVRK